MSYTNVTYEGLTRQQQAKLASPDSLVERPRSGNTCYKKHLVVLYENIQCWRVFILYAILYFQITSKLEVDR